MLPKSLIEGAAAEILQEIRGWDTIEAPDKIWTIRPTLQYVVDAVLIMNALIVVRKGTLHSNIIGDLINDPDTTKVK